MTRYLARTALAVLSTCCLSACGGGAPDDAKKPDPVATVHTAIVQAGAIAHETEIYGAVEAGPAGARALVAPAEAIVMSIAAPNGTTVKAGQVILVLRPSPATQTELAKAAIDIAAASTAYQRAQRLRSDGLVSDADVETARVALNTATAVRQNLGLINGGGVVRATGAGTVQGLTVRPGDQVAAGTALASIGSSTDLRARFGIDPVLGHQIHQGQLIQIAATGSTTGTPTTVLGVDPLVDPVTRQVSLYARLPATAQFASGQPLHARIGVGAAGAGVTIPYAALLDDGGKSFVFVVSNGTAKRVEVQPGNSSGDRIQVLSGLKAGEKLVTEGGTALEDGMKVAEAGSAR